MSEKSASAVEALEREFEELTRTADAELDAERQRIVMEFVQANGRGMYTDAFSPGLQRAIRHLPSGANNGVTSGTFASTFTTGTRSAMWAAVIGAAYQLITGLPQIYGAPESERLAKLVKLVKDVAIAAGVAGLTAYAAKQLETFLTQNAPRILSVICSKDAAEKFLFKVFGKGLKLSAAAGTLAAAGFSALTAFV